MPDLTEQIRGLSPAALDIFRQQLPQRLKELGELERNTALEQLSRLPELELGEFQPQQVQPTMQPETPWWQHPIVQTPLDWIRNVEQAAGTFLAAPFTPEVAGTEHLPWWQRERQEYEAWDEPSFQTEPLFRLPWTPQEIRDKPWTIGVKGVLETVPWFVTALATAGLGATAALGTRTGIAGLTRAAALGSKALKPVLAVESALAYPITKPLQLAARQVKKLIPSMLPATSRFIAPASDVLEKTITKDDWQRRVAQMFGRQPVLKSITEKIGGRAATVTTATEDTMARAILVGAKTQETLLSKGKTAMSTLQEIHNNPIRLFGVDELTGLTKIKSRVSGASKHINDIAENPAKYILSPQQKAYIEQVHRLEDWVLDGLREAGINPKMLKFDEFSHWVHREVIGKNVDEALVKIRSFAGKIGKKASWEKTRFYETAAEGVKAGILYEPSMERVVELYIQSAAKRIGDQRIFGMTAHLGQKSLERALQIAPLTIQTAKQTAATLAGARRLVAVINRAARGEKLTEQTLLAQERRFPEIGKALREVANKPTELRALAKEANQILEAAKTPYWKARAEKAVLMERARTPTLGTESTIMHPAFQGKIYPKNVAGELQRYWDEVGFSPLNKLATLSGEMRTLVAAADFSAPWIQGASGMARHPIAWGAGVRDMFRAFKNPKSHQEFLSKHLDDTMEFNNFGGFIGGFEYMEAMPQLQKLAGTTGRVLGGTTGKQLGQMGIRQTYGRFEAAFGAFGDVFRLNMWKALKGSAKNQDELFEIARHINRLSGVMSSKGLGIGKVQRDFEQAFLFFAPRYTRAGFALVGDMLKGGITGSEARKSIGSMLAAGAALYAGTAKVLGQEPNFDPTTGKFMTIEITDPITGSTRHFGIGGMMTSLVRFAADITASAVGRGLNEPMDFVKMNRFDNPFLKFLFSKSAPLTGFMEGMMFGHNYFGEPFENPGDYSMFMIEQVMPIALQSAFMEKEGLSATAIAAEEAGLRTFPRSDWEKRNIIRDQLAQSTYGMDWEQVGLQYGELAQLQLERGNPELQTATQVAAETTSKMSRGEGLIWDAWRKEGSAVEDRYRQSIMTASAEFVQTQDGTTFREKADEASAIRRAMYSQRELSPEYAEVNQYFNQPLTQEQLSRMNPKDIARREYYQSMYSPDMYDQFGNYRFDEADRREQAFVQRYGKGMLDYVEDYMGAKWDEPPALQALKSARDVLQPYWAIERQVWSQLPKELKQISDQILILERTDPLQAKAMLFNYPQIVFARRQIALYKKQMKVTNVEIANALNMFYRF